MCAPSTTCAANTAIHEAAAYAGSSQARVRAKGFNLTRHPAAACALVQFAIGGCQPPAALRLSLKFNWSVKAVDRNGTLAPVLAFSDVRAVIAAHELTFSPLPSGERSTSERSEEVG
jgi:hypothetical protein